MKAVILAGGYGTRLSEETGVRPKPMVPIGKHPIIWHIMKLYGYHGCTEFIICCGYKGHLLKEYFLHYNIHHADLSVDLANDAATFFNTEGEPWKVTLVDTGDGTMTGGRLKRVREFVGDDTFFMTYGDGVTDLDIRKTWDFHKQHGKHATLTAVQRPGRFGTFTLESHTNIVHKFKEKPSEDVAWINGGFFVLEPAVFDYIDGDATVWEQGPLRQLTSEGELVAYRHPGFWQCMDTLNDKHVLDERWTTGDKPWKVW